MDCPAFKKTEVLSFVTTWMNLEDAMLREKSQAQKDNVRSLFHTKSEYPNTYDQNKMVMPGGYRSRRLGR